MFGLQISVNGKVVCTASAKNHVFANVGLVTRINERAYLTNAIGREGELRVAWPTKALNEGDEVTIKLVEVAVSDPPDITELAPRT